MAYIFITTILIFIIIELIYNKKINIKEMTFDEILSPIVSRMEDNVEIAKKILNIIGNNHTKVKANKDEKSGISFYNHRTDTITMKNNPRETADFTRIVHVAHECLHTVQNKKYLIMNKLFSNIQILYFLFAAVYINHRKDEFVAAVVIAQQIIILASTFFIKIVIESDASYRSIYIAEEYVKGKISEEEREYFAKKVADRVHTFMPKYYFYLLMQGGLMLIITEFIALINIA